MYLLFFSISFNPSSLSLPFLPLPYSLSCYIFPHPMCLLSIFSFQSFLLLLDVQTPLPSSLSHIPLLSTFSFQLFLSLLADHTSLPSPLSHVSLLLSIFSFQTFLPPLGRSYSAFTWLPEVTCAPGTLTWAGQRRQHSINYLCR